MAAQLATQRRPLLPRLPVPMRTAPSANPPQRSAESVLGRLALDDPSPLPGASPIVREPQHREAALALRAAPLRLRRSAKLHHPRLLRVQAKAVLLQPFRQHRKHPPRIVLVLEHQRRIISVTDLEGPPPKPRLRGRAFEVRYADDATLVFEHEDDARRVLAVLAKRLEKYGLRLHPKKTRMVEFCRPSKSKRGGSQRERSFAMLGFTHYWGRSRKGRWVVKRKTAKDRLSRALRGIGRWCRSHRHWKPREQWAALSRKLRGHYAYYGITGNAPVLHRFRYEVERLWRKWLGRRSWSGRMSWERFKRLLENYPLPPVRVVHSVYR